MKKYKIHIENIESHIRKVWDDASSKDMSDLSKEYIDMFKPKLSVMFDYLEYCLLNIRLIAHSCQIPVNAFRVCEVTDVINIVFHTIEEADNKIKKTKVLLDGSLFKDLTKSKDYFYKVWDYETRSKLLYSKLHMSNILFMLSEIEQQSLTDGKLVFELPEKLMEDFEGQPDGYASPFSDYNRKNK